MATKASKNDKCLLLRLSDELLHAIQVEAHQQSKPGQQVTSQHLVRLALAEKFLPSEPAVFS